MRTLQGPGRDNEPDPFASLAKQLADLRRQIDDATAQVLRMAGLRAEPDLLRVLGSLVVEGDLSVPNGSIDNDALANPVAFGRAGGGVSVASVPASATALTDYTIVAPAGYSQAIMMVVGTLSGYSNSGNTSGYFYVQATANSTAMNNTTSTYASAGSPFAPPTSAATITLTGLAGDTIHCRLMGSADHASALSGAIAVIDAIAIFLR